LNTTLMPHSITHGDACFAYFNKIRGILPQWAQDEMRRRSINDGRQPPIGLPEKPVPTAVTSIDGKPVPMYGVGVRRR